MLLAGKFVRYGPNRVVVNSEQGLNGTFQYPAFVLLDRFAENAYQISMASRRMSESQPLTYLWSPMVIPGRL